MLEFLEKTEHGGALQSISYGEIREYWSNRRLYIPYENTLLQSKQAGVQEERILVLGEDFPEPETQILYEGVIFRHHNLGFNTRIATLSNWYKAKKHLVADNDMFCLLRDGRGQEFVYDIDWREGDLPIMEMSKEPDLIAAARKTYDELHRNSESIETWWEHRNCTAQLTATQKKKIENECEAIRELARLRVGH